MIKWQHSLLSVNAIEEIAKIPGAYISAKNNNDLFAADDLEETLTNLIGHAPNYRRISIKHIKNWLIFQFPLWL